MKVVTLEFTTQLASSVALGREHRCGEFAGYEFGPTDAYDDMATSKLCYLRIWGNQGTFIIPAKSLASLSFQENLETCPDCS